MAASNTSPECIVAEVLGVSPKDPGWELKCSNPSDPFVIFSTHPDAPYSVAKHSGAIVDVKSRTVCVPGSTAPTVCNVIPASSFLMHHDTGIVFQEADGFTHLPEGTKFYASYQGTVLRFWRRDGVTRVSTRSVVDATNSHWQGSEKFLAAYKRLGGTLDLWSGETSVEGVPTSVDAPENTTPEQVKVFMVVTPDVVTATRQDVGEGYLLDLTPGSTAEEAPLNRTATRGTYRPRELTLEEAESFLQHGYYHTDPALDARRGTGEAVLAVTPAGRHYSIQSPSYAWRWKMFGGNPNTLHRYYQLVDSAKFSTETLLGEIPLYPILFDSDTEDKVLGELETALPMLDVNETATVSDIVSQVDREKCIWIAYLLSLPLGRQKQALKAYKHFSESRALVSSFVTNPSNIDGWKRQTFPRNIPQGEARPVPFPGHLNDLLREASWGVKVDVYKIKGADLYAIGRYLRALGVKA